MVIIDPPLLFGLGAFASGLATLIWACRRRP